MKIWLRKITLQQRLSQFVGKRVEIQAENLSLEPGLLQNVFRKNFIRVTGELFVPLTLNQITVFNVSRTGRFARVGVTTTFESNFNNIPLVIVGKDFIELQGQGPARNRNRILIPLNKVIRLFGLKSAALFRDSSAYK